MESDTRVKAAVGKRFLLNGFPEDLKRNSSHLQITDNYVTNTRIRLRKVRIPETKEIQWSMTQFVRGSHDREEGRVTMHLSAMEYQVFSVFEANETRKNRYRYQFDRASCDIDLYLGPLWGLVIARPFIVGHLGIGIAANLLVADISKDPMFAGPQLADLTIEEIRNRFRKGVDTSANQDVLPRTETDERGW